VTLHPFDRRLLVVWLWVLGLAAAGELFVLSLWIVPVIQLVAVPFVPLPTVALYLTPALPLYFAAVAALRRARGADPSRGTRVALLALVLAALLALGAAAALALNARDPGLPPVAGKPEPVTLVPVQRVALMQLTDHYPALPPTCGDLCVALLMSGMAREVDVANVYTAALAVDGPVDGGRFRLRDRAQGCAAPVEDWPAWMRDRDLESLRLRTGGFTEVFTRRFRDCIAGSPALVRDADLRFIHAMPRHRSTTWLGIDWSAPAARVGSDRRIERGDGSIVAQWRQQGINRYAVPLVLDPMGAGFAPRRGTTGWGASSLRDTDTPAELPLNWWSTLRNADEVHQRANDTVGLDAAAR
jgi:hypothetical protein